MRYWINSGVTVLTLFILSISAMNAQIDRYNCNTYVPPTNDICRDAIPFTGSVNGVTCCGEIEQIDLCGDMGTGIWYVYDQVMDGTTIQITNNDISGPIGVEIYSGDCDNLELLQRSDCSGFTEKEFEVPNCNSQIFIHISTKEEGCGAFTMSASDIAGCNAAEDCDDITAAQTFEPISDQGEVCISSCLNYSCNSSCTNNSVWFELNTDNLATLMQITIDNADFEPLISVILRGSGCDDGQFRGPPCQPMVQGEAFEVGATQGSTYYIEISSADGNVSEFDLCINTIKEDIDCAKASLSVFRPEYPTANPNGPFCPGETVTFCYDLEFFVDFIGEGNNCQWLQGIVPVLGGGWDLSANNLSGDIPAGWMYLPDGSVDYNVTHPTLAAGVDANNNITLEHGPGGLSSGDLLPAGWWYFENGDGAGCEPDGDPDNGWGLETPCGETAYLTHCFELTTNSPTAIIDCDDEFQKDLSISIFVFADGETGCYDDSACTGDTPATFNGEIDCSTLHSLSVNDEEICSKEFVSIPVSVDGGYEVPISIEVISAGNTTGAQDWIFESGSGIIPDQIINNGNSIETVTYGATLYNPGSDCPVPQVLFDVIVHPHLNVDVPTTLICEGTEATFTASGGYDSYTWYDLDNNVLSQTASANIANEGVYIVQVQDGICSAEIEVQINSAKSEAYALLQDSVNVCNNDIGTLATAINLGDYVDPSSSGLWLDGFGFQIDPMVSFDGNAAGREEFRYTTNNAVAPCMDTTYIFTVIVEECVCPIIELAATNPICPDESGLVTAYSVSGIEGASDPGTWSLTDGPAGYEMSTGNIYDPLSETFNVLDSAVPGIYTFTYTLDNTNYGPSCETSETVEIQVGGVGVAEVLTTFTACNAQDGTEPVELNLNDLLVSGSTGDWVAVTSGVAIDGTGLVNFDGATPQDYEFTYTTNTAILPCVDNAYSVIVTVIDCACEPLEFNPMDDVCQSDMTVDINALIIDAGVGVWSISSLSATVLPELRDNREIEITSATEPGEYTLTYTLSNASLPATCDNSYDITFNVVESVSAELTTAANVCNQDVGIGPDFLDLDDLFISGSTGVWSTDETIITIDADNVVVFTDQPVRAYEFTYTTNTATLPCVDNVYTVVVTVDDCSCPVLDFLPLNNYCQSDETVDINALIVDAPAGEWTINSLSATTLPEIVDNSRMEILQTTEPGEYTLTYTVTDPLLPSGCDGVVEIAFSVSEQTSAEVLPQIAVCNQDTGTEPDFINLDDLFISGASGTWSTSETGLTIEADNTVSFTGQDIRDYIFTYTTDNAMLPCTNESYDVRVTVKDCSCPALVLGQAEDFCQDDIAFDLNNLLIDAEEGVWSVAGAFGAAPPVIQGDELFITSTTDVGTYELTYTLSDPNVPSSCDTEVTLTFNVFAGPTADVVSNVVVCNEVTGSSPVLVDLDTLVRSGSTGDWSFDASQLTVDADNVVSFEGLVLGDYVFRYKTNDAVAPCEDVEYITTFTVIDCSCPSVVWTGEVYCQEANVINLNDNIVSGDPGTWANLQAVGTQTELPVLNETTGEVEITENTSPGLYEVEYIYSATTIPGSCDDRIVLAFNIVAAPAAEVTANAVVCNSAAGTLPTQLDIDTLYRSGSTGVWTIDGNTLIPNVDNVINFDGIPVGNYTLTYTTDDAVAPCENVSYDVTVAVNDCSCPLIALDNGPALCNDMDDFDLNSLVLQGVGSGTWTNTDGPEAMDIDQGIAKYNGKLEGTYTFEFTLDEIVPSGCEQTAQITLVLAQSLALDVTPEVTVCNQMSSQGPVCIDLTTLSSVADGTWSKPSSYTGDFSDITNVCFEGFNVGEEFIFTFLTNNAVAPCSDIDGSTVVKVIDCNCPNLTITNPEPLCNLGGVVSLSSLETAETVEGTWAFVNGPEAITLGADYTFDATSVQVGLYTFEFTPVVTPDALCDQSTMIEVQVFETLNPGTGNVIDYCAGESELLDLNTLLDNSDPGGFWTEVSTNSSVGGFDATAGTFQIDNEAAGIYEFNYEHIASATCPSVAAVVLVVLNGVPVADAGPDFELTCAENTVTLGGPNMADGPRIEYLWTEIDGTVIPNNETADPIITQPGVYTVQVMDNLFGCESSDEVVITEDRSIPTFDARVLPISCDGSELGGIEISNSVGGNGDYRYSIDGGATWIDRTIFDNLPAGTYNIMIQDGNGCESSVEGLEVQEPIFIGLNIGEDQEVQFGDFSITLNLTTIASAEDINIVVWEENGQIICEGEHNECFEVEVDPQGSSTYCVTVSDQNGCEETQCIVLTEVVDPNIYMANVFTPDQTSFNNRYFVQSDENIVSVSQFTIYDRWGEVVFVAEENHPPNNPAYGWDGKFNETNSPTGVYTYFGEAIDVLGDKRMIRGDVTLLR